MTIVRNTSITVFGRWLGVAAAAGAGLLVADTMGAAGAGTFAMIRVIPAGVAAMLGAGVGPANAYLVGGRKYPVQAITETTVALALVAGALGWGLWLAGLGFIHARFYPMLTTGVVALVGLGVLLNLLRDYLNSIQQGLQSFTEATIVLCLDDVGSLVLLLPLLGGVGGTGLIVASSLGGLVMSVLAALFFLMRAGLRPWPRIHRAIASEALWFGLKSHVGRVANALNWRLDVMILAAFASVEVVGCYAVASKTAELFRPLGASLTYVLRPLLAGLDSDQARRKGVVLYRWVFAINLATVAIMALVGGPLIMLLFGAEFAPAVPAFQILLIGLAAHGADPVLNGYYIGTGRPELITYTSLAGLVITVIGDVTLIPAYGLNGAAIASSVAYSVRAASLTAIFLWTTRVSVRALLGIEELTPGPA